MYDMGYRIRVGQSVRSVAGELSANFTVPIVYLLKIFIHQRMVETITN